MSSVKRYTEDGDPILQRDGFRKRRKRPKDWAEKARKAGIIRDPDAPEPEPKPRKPGDVVIFAPVATMRGNSTEG